MTSFQRAFASSSCQTISKALGSPSGLLRGALLATVLALTTALAGCPEDKVVVKNLFLEVTSDALASGKLESLRILFQKEGARFPVDAREGEFNPSLGARDPSVAPVRVSVTYDGPTFGDGRNVTVNITGWSGGAPVARFEGQVDLDTALILKVRLVGIPSGCDQDGDGFFDCGVADCCAQGSAFADCGGDDATTNPWVIEAACKACSDTVDHDCSGDDRPCVDGDGDQIADCAEEATCGLGDPSSGPGKPEICDGKDNNCKDGADEGLTFNYRGQVLDKGDACGLGACAGGSVECNGAGGLRCSNDNKRKATEDCATNVDDNCNGLVNEGCVPADFDGDGSLAPADCNDFDAGVYPGRLGEPCCPKTAQGNAGAEAACDLNCDGDVAFCETGDVDGDGVTTAEGDCNDDDPHVGPGEPEKCGDGVDQDCAGGDLACTGLIDADSDGWPMGADCNDDDPTIGPDEVETCNGEDDDCDLMIDEGNPGGGAQCGTSDVGDCAFGAEQCQNSSGTLGQIVCVGAIDAKTSDICDDHDEDCDGATDEDYDYEGLAVGAACDGIGGCGTGTVVCATGRTDLATCSTNPNGPASGAATEVCDTIDNDCDGDLNEGLNDVADSTCVNLGVCAANRTAIVASCTAAGTWTCDYGAVPGYEAGAEASCDALDNDCDGSVDEDLAFTEPDGAVRAFGSGCDGEDTDECANGVVACHPNDPTRTVCSETGGPREELCDGLDNDCDGDTDEDFRDTATNRVRLAGALFGEDNGAFLGEACGTGACAGGVVVCATTLTLTCSSDPRTPASPSAPTDICDGVDNDCDGGVDESYLAGGTVKLQGALNAADNNKVKGASCGVGECAGGTVVCASTTTLGCSTDGNGQTTSGGVTVAKPDTCNGKDDNCNGTTDDDFVATTGSNRKPLAGALYAIDNGKMKGAACGIGECLKPSAGSVVCNAAGTALSCSSDVRATNDVCDNLDNDCDGLDDDPFRTTSGTTLQGAKLAADNGKIKGAGCGAGSCAAGKVVCTASKTALVCDSEIKATTEACDTIDNDCDGASDESFTLGGLAMGATCDGTGGCGQGVVTCALGSTNTATCSTSPNGPASQATTEVCDGADNDCDEVIDNGFNVGSSCPAVGACAAGQLICNSSQSATICNTTDPSSASFQGSTEVCDAVDNDCDGQLNEGFDYQGIAVGDACTGTGRCATLPGGNVECVGGAAVCSTNPGGTEHGTPVAEACDGVDQDCDGTSDQAETTLANPPACAETFGVCAGAITPPRLCGGSNGWLACDDAAYKVHNAAFDANTDVCDNLDNDCDNSTDALDTIDFVRRACPDQDGVCAGAKQFAAECVAGVWIGTCDSDVTGEYEANNAAFGAEICDGLDNNCDTEMDKGDADLVIPDCELTVGECLGAKKPLSLCSETLAGWGGCTSTEYNANSAALHAGVSKYGAELCDTFDNNCNGSSDADDSDLVRQLCQNQLGVCAGTLKPAAYCQNGSWGTTICPDEVYDDQKPLFGLEICDTHDNDCDNLTDDEDDQLVRPNCELTLGVCNGTSKPADLCGLVTPGVWAPCTEDTYEAQRPGPNDLFPPYLTTDSLCDDADNNCDGSTDEAFPELLAAHDPDDVGLSKTDPCGTGVCDLEGNGVVQCNSLGDALVCSTDASASYNAVESCDDADDDCDGSTDETFTSLATAYDPDDVGKPKNDDCGTGVCDPGDTGVVQCDEAGTALVCSTDLTPPQTSETCNDLDDDCDGETDETFLTLLTAFNQVDVGKIKGAACGTGLCDPGNVGVVQCLANGTALECSTDDSPPQTTEVCNSVDDDCDGSTDEGVSTDLDGDGFASCIDCNDALGNSEDLDKDNICDQGVRATCTGGTASGCDDNCPVESNASQADSNSNGIGNACDPCTTGLTEPYEVCGDCLDNECDTFADGLDGSCTYRRIISIETDPTPGEATASAVEKGHAISFSFDHAFLVASGNSRADGTGDDVRIYYRNPTDGSFLEIDRVLDPESAWMSTATKIWFKAQEVITADVSAGDEVNNDYYLYANVAGTAKKDEQVVFHFADFFDRTMADPTKVGPDATIESPPVDAWAETETTDGLLSISNTVASPSARSLTFQMENQADENMRPIAYRSFTPMTAARWMWRTRWNWTRTGDTAYALIAQLGNGASFTASPTANTTYPGAGVGPNVVWARSYFGFENTGVGDLGGTNGTTATRVVDDYAGASEIAVELDLTTDVSNGKKFKIDPDGSAGPLAQSAAIAFNDPSLTELSAIRYIAHDQDEDDFTGQKFDYVMIYQLVPTGELEPIAYLGTKEPIGPACTVSTGPLARWYLDDARDDVLGGAATVLSDSAPTPLQLTLVPANGQPTLSERASQMGLKWTSSGAGGNASVDYASTKLSAASPSGLDDSKAATIEFVAEILGAASESFIVDFQRATNQHQLAVSLSSIGSTYTIKVYVNNAVVAAWTADVAKMGRTVFTVAIDTTQGNGNNRVKLYRDGDLRELANAAAVIAQETLIDVGDAGTLRLGNSLAGTSSPLGYVFYAAVYQTALTPGVIESNANVLRADDDRR